MCFLLGPNCADVQITANKHASAWKPTRAKKRTKIIEGMRSVEMRVLCCDSD